MDAAPAHAPETAERVPARIVLASIAALWICYFGLATLRGWLVGLGMFDELLWRRAVVILASMAVTVALWPHFGWGTLAALAVVYTVLALWVFRTLAVEHASTPPLLSETLRELASDRDAVFAARARPDEGERA